MKNFKKISAAFLAAIMSLSVMTACSNGSSDGSTEKQYDFNIVEESLADELYGIAVKKGNEPLRDEIQNALDEAIADGSAAKVAEKWFGKDTIYSPETKTVTTDVDAKSDKDTIKLGCDVHFAPMGFMQGDDVVGFDIDLARLLIEEKMGKKLVVQPITWENKEAELNADKIDVLWNGLTITDERLAAMCFTEAYMQNKQVIIVPKDSQIKSVKDLEGKKIAMQKQSSAVDAFSESGITATTTELKDNVGCLTELKQKRQDAVIMDSVVADYYLSLKK